MKMFIYWWVRILSQLMSSQTVKAPKYRNVCKAICFEIASGDIKNLCAMFCPTNTDDLAG